MKIDFSARILNFSFIVDFQRFLDSFFSLFYSIQLRLCISKVCRNTVHATSQVRCILFNIEQNALSAVVSGKAILVFSVVVLVTKTINL